MLVAYFVSKISSVTWQNFDFVLHSPLSLHHTDDLLGAQALHVTMLSQTVRIKKVWRGRERATVWLSDGGNRLLIGQLLNMQI